MKGVMRFGKKGKLNPKYVGPYRILKRIGKVAYELELPADLAAVHPVFHISLLKKCVGDPASIVPLESVAVKDSLSYEDVPVEILDRQVRRLRNKEVASVKVLWRSQSVEGATWEAEAAMKSKFRFSASRSRLDRFPISSSADSVVPCPRLGGSSGRDSNELNNSNNELNDDETEDTSQGGEPSVKKKRIIFPKLCGTGSHHLNELGQKKKTKGNKASVVTKKKNKG
ncbi:hypothetical protein MTR67_037848 [Solanum verrucosum]|uniref:Tf2-1-like SH3-like domain-containing protein n=1 Tax=Solanum verrucosum TaxID=315347 RepID=A0AAF0ZNV1_SOLVR|nr:hypothetical protein MTR67_037848 [Solanum verrucosum]